MLLPAGVFLHYWWRLGGRPRLLLLAGSCVHLPVSVGYHVGCALGAFEVRACDGQRRVILRVCAVSRRFTEKERAGQDRQRREAAGPEPAARGGGAVRGGAVRVPALRAAERGPERALCGAAVGPVALQRRAAVGARGGVRCAVHAAAAGSRGRGGVPAEPVQHVRGGRAGLSARGGGGALCGWGHSVFHAALAVSARYAREAGCARMQHAVWPTTPPFVQEPGAVGGGLEGVAQLQHGARLLGEALEVLKVPPEDEVVRQGDPVRGQRCV